MNLPPRAKTEYIPPSDTFLNNISLTEDFARDADGLTTRTTVNLQFVDISGGRQTTTHSFTLCSLVPKRVSLNSWSKVSIIYKIVRLTSMLLTSLSMPMKHTSLRLLAPSECSASDYDILRLKCVLSKSC